MVIWLNDVTTIWDLEVGHNPRTADVVFVVTQPRTTQKALNLPEAGGGAAANLPPANDEGPGVFREPRHVPQDAVPTVTKPNLPQPERDSSNSRSTVDTAPPSAIELQQVVGEVKAAFRAIRTKTGVMVRYEITNGSDADLAVRPKAVLIRADGRILAYGILRKSVDPGRLGIIPRGATETGTIDIATATGRTIELIIPLAPLASPIAAPPAAGQAPSQPRPRRDAAQTARAPFVLQATFNGMDRLPITTLP